jgi:hypothetical protein
MEKNKMNKYKSSHQTSNKVAQFINTLGNYNNSPNSQRKRLLEFFNQVHIQISTTQAREDLGIMQPAARIFELRHNFGYDILCERIKELDHNGIPHRMGLYTFLGKNKTKRSHL